MPIELQRVRSLFAKPDKTRDSQFMRHEVARRMEERLSLIKMDPCCILDAGCGDFGDAALLATRFKSSRVLDFDISLPILAEVKQENEEAGNPIDFVCGNVASLPFGKNSIDMIWSNLALHWHPDPREIFREWNRVLKANGLLMFSCFGSGTFSVLRKSFSAIDRYSHVHPFESMISLGDLLIETGFTEPVLEREWIDVIYKDIGKLLADVRAFGGNAMTGRRKGFFGKKEYEKLLKLLELGRDKNGNVSLGFEIVVAHAFKKDDFLPAGEKVIQFYGTSHKES